MIDWAWNKPHWSLRLVRVYHEERLMTNEFCMLSLFKKQKLDTDRLSRCFLTWQTGVCSKIQRGLFRKFNSGLTINLQLNLCLIPQHFCFSTTGFQFICPSSRVDKLNRFEVCIAMIVSPLEVTFTNHFHEPPKRWPVIWYWAGKRTASSYSLTIQEISKKPFM